MFKHIFINRLKVLLRNKEVIFWTLVFPIALATFFNLSLSNMATVESFELIPIAIVENDEYDKNFSFQTAMTDVSQGEDPLFHTTLTTEEEAIKLLEDSKIDGYIILNPSVELIVKESGINQNIIKSFSDTYMQLTSSANYILSSNPRVAQDFYNSLTEWKTYTKETPLTSSEPNNLLSYFYVLIAMSCFYGSTFGNNEIMYIQANLSTLAARINIAPVHKLKIFFASMTASVLIHFAELLILLVYLVFVLNIDFGTKTGLVLLSTFIGSITGISFGAFISAFSKKDENTKTGILIGITMLCSFLAGMMYQNMKYIIARNVPLLSYLNPVNLLTDAFYSLYYYDTLKRYTLNMALLILFIAIFWAATYKLIRRRKYASI